MIQQWLLFLSKSLEVTLLNSITDGGENIMKKLISISGLVLLTVMLGSIVVVNAEPLQGFISSASVSDKSVTLTIFPQDSDFGLWDPKTLSELELSSFSGILYVGIYHTDEQISWDAVTDFTLNPYKVTLADKQIKLFFELPDTTDFEDDYSWVKTTASISVGDDVITCLGGPGFAWRRR